MNYGNEKAALAGGNLEAGMGTYQQSTAPVHWNPQWRHFPLDRKTADEPRKPWFEVENSRMPEYWDGYRQSWKGWTVTVDEEYDIGFMPWLNDIAVIDCDVKKYFATEDGSKSASMTVKYGIDDLEREVVKRGHTMTELETYTVSTKSGGFHLYFALGGRPGFTKHHREDWRIDVIGSERCWVAAPPTPGYQVVKDVPVVEMPDWLYVLCRDINRELRPVGGRKRVDLDGRVKQLRPAVQSLDCDKGLLKSWISAQYERVELANQQGNWNSTIFEVACDFFAMGFDQSTVEQIIIPAAQPADSREERNALRTIASARSYKSKERS